MLREELPRQEASGLEIRKLQLQPQGHFTKEAKIESLGLRFTVGEARATMLAEVAVKADMLQCLKTERNRITKQMELTIGNQNSTRNSIKVDVKKIPLCREQLWLESKTFRQMHIDRVARCARFKIDFLRNICSSIVRTQRAMNNSP
jgi:hypothetical protein